MHYYQFNIADYRKDTAHLTRLEHYIYRTLIDWYFLDEVPIPKETQTVSRRLSLVTDELDSLKNVLNDFFVLTDDGWLHKRINLEIRQYHAKAEVNRANGKKGGRPPSSVKPVHKTQTVNEINPGQSEINPNQEPLTNNQKPLTNLKDKDLSPIGSIDSKKHADEMFAQFYSFYPRKAGRAGAKKAWLKIKPDLYQKIIDNTQHRLSSHEWLGEKRFIPYPATWLNKEQWDDEIILPNIPAKSTGPNKADARLSSTKDAMTSFVGNTSSAPSELILLGDSTW